jgi:hypothetical protein
MIDPQQQLPLPPIAVHLGTLTTPPDLETAPYWRSKRGLAVLNYRNLVMSKFIQITFDDQFAGLVFRKQARRSSKEHIRLEAELWKSCWQLIEACDVRFSVFYPCCSQLHDRAETLVRLILDQKLLHFISASDSDSVETATKHIRQVQTGNRKLQSTDNHEDRENPFGLDCFTGQFIEQVLLLAEISDPIEVALNNLIAARMALTSCWREKHPRFQGKKAAEWRGRAKSRSK